MGEKPEIFNFDQVFKPETSQEMIYDHCVKDIVDGVLQGVNGTVICYGQTGSGKTFTMMGAGNDEFSMGIVPRSVTQIYDSVAMLPDTTDIEIKLQMAEIYMERIDDLIDRRNINLEVKSSRTQGFFIDKCTNYSATSENDIFDAISLGLQNRRVAKTNMNDNSSRSHLIFILSVVQTDMNTMSRKSGRLYLVDLAGSEQVKKAGTDHGNALKEATTINQSLTQLGVVIRHLTDKKLTHVPYRDSKLT